MSLPRSLTIPAWVLEAKGQRFLVGISSGDHVIIDGGHSTPDAVAKAQVLHEKIAAIRAPGDVKWYMLTVEEVPEFVGKVNEEAIKTLNQASLKLSKRV